MRKIRAAIIGVGGFAGVHHGALKALEEQGECKVVATADPSEARRAAASETFGLEKRGTRLYEDWQEMLGEEGDALELVTTPTPIPLHAPMHKAIVERGLACYLEKPPTLDPAELRQMLAVENRAERDTQVGFNFIVEEPRQRLKERILEGEWGAVQSVGLPVLWPRGSVYYSRSDWPGKLLHQSGSLVLDSPFGNAAAHHVHNALFWAGGRDVLDWGRAQSVQAELYRAHEIQGCDTVFVAAQTESGVALRIGMTHACSGPSEQEEIIECEQATLFYKTGGGYRVEYKNGREEERGDSDKRNLLQENFRAYFAYLRGDRPRPMTTLTESVPFVHLNALAYIAAGEIVPVSEEHITRAQSEKLGAEAEIAGVREACKTFALTGQFPAAQGLTWGRKATPPPATPADLPRLRPLVEQMAARLL